MKNSIEEMGTKDVYQMNRVERTNQKEMYMSAI